MTADFTAYAEIGQEPDMIDLHLHLDGSLAPEDVLQLAKLSGICLPRENADALRPLLEAEPDCQNLGEYLEKFDLPLQVLQTEQTISLSVYLLLKRLAMQGLCYAEIRFAPQLHTARGLTQMQVVDAAAEGLQKGVCDTGMPAQLILCCMRFDNNQDANFETIRVAKAYLDRGVCAADLAGNEAANPAQWYAPVFSLADELGVPFIIHAGEAAGPESIRQALTLGARRIGHGVRAMEDPALMAELAQKKVPLETCFTSNLQTKAVAGADSYPLAAFLNMGIPATINTDNMTVSATDLKQEYLLLQKQFGLSDARLQETACSAADAAFLPDSQKDELKARIAQAFIGWLHG